ncbi:MAG: hypothetical protein EZS28_011323 [Streblomastix strix]|uniref:Uncharacterized protein n=1 Tax=Streblomastix strix TaxID=222440 RepID=A0A5J4WDV3_9EUKA|nr:MAG: hypothetical protein EZS28_011323 [Streblomastix strix]
MPFGGAVARNDGQGSAWIPISFASSFALAFIPRNQSLMASFLQTPYNSSRTPRICSSKSLQYSIKSLGSIPPKCLYLLVAPFIPSNAASTSPWVILESYYLTQLIQFYRYLLLPGPNFLTASDNFNSSNIYDMMKIYQQTNISNDTFKLQLIDKLPPIRLNMNTAIDNCFTSDQTAQGYKYMPTVLPLTLANIQSFVDTMQKHFSTQITFNSGAL